MLLRRLLPLALLPFTAFTHAACTLTDPTLTLQSYTVNPQQERIVMYWQKQNGKAWDRYARCLRISIKTTASRWR